MEIRRSVFTGGAFFFCQGGSLPLVLTAGRFVRLERDFFDLARPVLLPCILYGPQVVGVPSFHLRGRLRLLKGFTPVICMEKDGVHLPPFPLGRTCEAKPLTSPPVYIDSVSLSLMRLLFLSSRPTALGSSICNNAKVSPPLFFWG